MTESTKRYLIEDEIQLKFTSFHSSNIKEYYGIDDFYNRSVKIKTFELPKKEEAKRLAITLWEREIRLIRRAMGITGGTFLLQLMDAYIDYEGNKLNIISSKYGKSLNEWMTESHKLWFFNEPTPDARKEIWLLFRTLLNGIRCLHEAKLIHRNINPDVIFFSEESDENVFKIGGFTWSLYLHNLNYIPKREKEKRSTFTLFQAPETFIQKEERLYLANPFVSDIYSLGMMLCFLFYKEFPKTPLFTLTEWNSAYSSIKDYFSSSQTPLNKTESDLILSCISHNPKERPRTINDFLSVIVDILEQFEQKKIIFEERPYVYWYNADNSLFLQRTALQTSTTAQEIRSDPNAWLLTNFQNARIFITGIERDPLIVVNKDNIPFSLKRTQNKYDNTFNDEVLSIFSLYSETARKIFAIIKNKRPIGIFRKGFQHTIKKGLRDIQSPWKRLWRIAQIELKEKKSSKNEEERFIQSLEVMLEAEKKLESKKIIAFRYKDSKRNPVNETEWAKLEISFDFGKEMHGRERKDLLRLISEFKSKNKGLIELSANNNPSSYWDNYNQWSIRSIDKRNITIQIERPLKKKDKDLLHEGVIRPFDMSMSFRLYKRKERAIEYTIDNDLLLSALLNPWYRTFFLGMDFKKEKEVVSQILNTIPMYLVQGPPGTGKTWVASTVVGKILENNPYSRILISSKDHHPLNHLVEEVIDKIPKNLKPSPICIRTISSERELDYKESDFILKYKKQNITKEILKIAAEDTSLLGKISPEIENKWRIEVFDNSISPSLRWTDEILKVANVVFTTSTSSTIDWLRKNAPPFDWIILEEAAKSYPIELILPMNLGHRWILIGDQKQLPPYKYKEMEIIVSDILDEEQLEEEQDDYIFMEEREIILKNIKLFETLFNTLKQVKTQFSAKEYNPCYMLNEQRRLPPLISEMISTIFYDTRFIDFKEKPKENDPFTSPEFLIFNQLIWVDIPHASKNNEYKEDRGGGSSIINKSEANVIVKLIRALKYNKTAQIQDYSDLVFLTPYKAQRDHLANTFHSNFDTSHNVQELSHNCHTIDSYQGKQEDIVFISLVRNNNSSDIKGALGFLIEEERLNVMFSRVRKRMIIIGCSAQFIQFKDEERCKAINDVYEFVKNKGKLTSLKELEELL